MLSIIISFGFSGVELSSSDSSFFLKVVTNPSSISTVTFLFIKSSTDVIGIINEPTKHDDHCLDELRYYIMNLTNQTKPVKSEIQKHKDKLYKQIKRNHYEMHPIE